MAFAPRSALTKRLLTGAQSLIPLAVLYGVLLLASWTPETLSTLLPGDFVEGTKAALQGKPRMQFLPNIEAVGKLLSAPIASVSAWAHLQFIAFFCARWIWLDGAEVTLLVVCDTSCPTLPTVLIPTNNSAGRSQHLPPLRGDICTRACPCHADARSEQRSRSVIKPPTQHLLVQSCPSPQPRTCSSSVCSCQMPLCS